MRQEFVSIIVPVYNGEKTLAQCLDAVLKQTYPSYEVIVVDNHSTDRTKEIIGSFQEKSDKVCYVFEGYRRRGAARNAGIRVAKGDIIAMIDADCLPPSDWIATLIAPIVGQNENIVMGAEENLIDRFYERQIQSWDEAYYKNNTHGNYIQVLDTKNCAFRSDVFKKFLFDQNLGNGEDTELSLRLKGHYRIFFHSTCLVGHYHKSSLAEWMRVMFDRAAWTKKIYVKHRDRQDLMTHAIFEGVKIKNPYWEFVREFFYFICFPTQKRWFQFVSRISWVAGLFFGVR